MAQPEAFSYIPCWVQTCISRVEAGVPRLAPQNIEEGVKLSSSQLCHSLHRGIDPASLVNPLLDLLLRVRTQRGGINGHLLQRLRLHRREGRPYGGRRLDRPADEAGP